jgi:hypothetical protein
MSWEVRRGEPVILLPAKHSIPGADGRDRVRHDGHEAASPEIDLSRTALSRQKPFSSENVRTRHGS